MISSLLKKWDEFQFDAMIKRRIETTQKVLKENGPLTTEEVDAVCGLFAKEMIRKHYGTTDEKRLIHLKKKVSNARKKIQSLFQDDGHREEFAFALSYVCVGWDADAYRKGKKKHNLTLNCLLGKDTILSGHITEEMLFNDIA